MIRYLNFFDTLTMRKIIVKKIRKRCEIAGHAQPHARAARDDVKEVIRV
ncbi:MAG TPA: hypothetical protein VFU05_14040 [Cyclobacteriaceae bacterium]|nr:hypothetical protein [Cyclobacteriaceae bacterium]